MLSTVIIRCFFLAIRMISEGYPKTEHSDLPFKEEIETRTFFNQTINKTI